MALLTISPHSGINKRFPAHRLVGKKTQMVRQLLNMLSLDGSITSIKGSARYDNTDLGDDCKWAKRVYYKINDNQFRRQFCVINRTMYKGKVTDDGLEEAQVDGKTGITTFEDNYLRDATVKSNAAVITYLVDGKDFFKFVPNIDGNWNKVTTLVDVDGVTIEPVDVAEYQDRLWCIPKNRNVVLFSKNLNAENFSDSTDAGLIQLPPGNGGYPKALFKHRGFLYVMHEDYFTPISGSSVSTYGVPPGNIIWGFGTKATRSVVPMKNRFTFLNTEDNEIYQSAGTLDSTKLLSYEMNLKTIINPNKADLTVGILHDDLLRYSMVKTGDFRHNYEAVYSFNEEKWCGETEDQFVSAYSPWTGPGDKGELITARSDKGLLMKTGTGFAFDNSDIHFRMELATYELDPIRDSIIERFYIDADPGGNYVLPFSYFLDSRISTDGTERPSMQGETLGLGLISIKNQESFVVEAFPKFDRSRGRHLRFLLDTTLGDRGIKLFNLYVVHNPQNRKVVTLPVGA